MKNVLNIIFIEIKSMLYLLLLVPAIIVTVFILEDSEFSASFFNLVSIMTYTSFAIAVETKYFKEKFIKFSKFPLSNFQMFVVDSYKMAAFIIIFTMIVFSFTSFYKNWNDFHQTLEFVLVFPFVYYALFQSVIAYRNLKAYNEISTRIFAGLGYLLYQALILTIIVSTNATFTEEMAQSNLFYFLTATYIIFIGLEIPANYLIFKNRGDYLK